MTERLHFHFSLSCIGEGNGNPLQCPCLENPRDGGAWWVAIYGIAQSQTRLKQLSNSSSSFEVKWKSLNCVWLFVIPWTVACQAPLSIEFSRPEYQSGWPFPSPGDLPNRGIESRSRTLQVNSLLSKPPRKPWWLGKCSSLRLNSVPSSSSLLYYLLFVPQIKIYFFGRSFPIYS